MERRKKPFLWRAGSSITHPLTGGILLASVSAAKLPLSALSLLEKAGLEVERPWVGKLAAGVVGFGAGYGALATLRWLRWQAIILLLKYHGWLYDQTSIKTKMWGLLLKLLVGPGPHGTFDYQDALPKLPVPELEDTCEKYLRTVKPMLTADEYATTEKLVKDLLEKDGPILQQHLLKKYKEDRSWLADWWLSTAYLMRKEPIAINVNFYMTSRIKPEVSTNPVARACNLLLTATRFWEDMKHNKYPPDMIMDTLPVCMDGARFLFSTVREPSLHGDVIKQYMDSKHIIVIRNGVYYKVYVYAKDERGHETVLSKSEFKMQLQRIVGSTEDNTGELPVAVLTSQERTVWAKHREMLQQTPVNAATLHEVESALFVYTLGSQDVHNMSEHAKLTLTGNCFSRWFDKSIVMESYGESTNSGCNMEHAGADATHFAQLWEKVVQHERYGPDGDILPDDKPPRQLAPPKRLHWNFDKKMTAIIKETQTSYQKQIEAIDVVAISTKVAKRWMKSKGVSPDGLLQMAIQLSYWRMHKAVTKTYEPASTRLFALGRTENINPVSEESVRWTKMMDDPDVSNKDKVKALKDAVKYQTKSKIDATAGYGCDRHMLGLCLAAREMGRDLPAVFRDKSWSLPMKLSTSQVPTQMGKLKQFVPETVCGGFAPACEDGYGILYVFFGDELVNINITSWKTCPETDSHRFSEYLLSGLEDIKHIMN